MPHQSAFNFSDILFERAERESHALAYYFYSENSECAVELSLQQLSDRVKSIAQALESQQLRGERVLLAFKHGPEFIYAFYACLALGAIAVPVSPPSRNKFDQRLQSVLRDAQPKLVLSNAELLEVFEQKVDYGDQPRPTFRALEHLKGEPSLFKNSGCGGDDIAFLQYTSGSTGEPKGVMISHANLLDNSAQIQSACRSNAQSSAIIWLPFYHDMGLIGGVLQSMYAGTSARLMSPVSFIQQPMRWLERISETRSTIAVAPNFALELCCDKVSEEQLRQLDLSSLQCVLCGAEPVNANTVRRFSETFAACGFRYDAFMPSYGLAETTLYVSGALRDSRGPTVLSLDAAALSTDQIRDALPGQRQQQLIANGVLGDRVCIAKPDTCEQLGDNQVGEIWISGASVAKGYWRRDKLNSEVFGARLSSHADSENYYRSGDLGFSRDGDLYITGRIKDLIIVRAKNHYPQDIEDTATRAHPLISTGAAAAFALDEGQGEQLVLLAELSRQGLRELKTPDFAVQVVQAIDRAITAEHELSAAKIVLLKPARLLKTSSGKIQRRANKRAWLEAELQAAYSWERPQQVLASCEPSAAVLTSRPEVEAFLLSQLALRSGLAQHDIALDQPFSSYGLDSLAAIELVGLINERLDSHTPIDATELWNYPTVQSLLDFIFAEAPEASPPVDDTAQGGADIASEVAALRALLDS